MIIVFGSLKMSVRLKTDHLFSAPSDILTTDTFHMEPGGKGANQALAAARIGARVAMVGMVGDDSHGNQCLHALKRDGVLTSGVGHSPTLPTGMSVTVEGPDGKRQTVLVAGANAEAAADQVPDEILGEANFVLMQMEAPPEENIALMEKAKANGAQTMLNLAPAIKISRKTLHLLDYLVVNMLEAGQIGELLGIGTGNDAIKIAQALAKEGDLTCVLTLGKQGSVAVTKDGQGWIVPPMDIPVVADRSGAGDVYCGTLAGALHLGLPLARALKQAGVAASLACEKVGTQESFPYLDAIEKRLNDAPDPKPVKL